MWQSRLIQWELAKKSFCKVIFLIDIWMFFRTKDSVQLDMHRTQNVTMWVCTCQDFCPWNVCICTRTYVLGTRLYLPGLWSLELMYTYQDFVLGIYVYVPGLWSLEYKYINIYINKYIYIHIYLYLYLCTRSSSLESTYMYQDFALGIYVYVPRLRPWNIGVCTRAWIFGIYVFVPGLRPWNICKCTRTLVHGVYVYVPGLCSWKICICTRRAPQVISSEQGYKSC